MEKARTCAFQANYHLIWATKYRRKVLRTMGYLLLTARVDLRVIEKSSSYHSDHVHVFVSAKPKICIPDIVSVLESNSARVLFVEEFPQVRLRLWGGHLWSEGYAVRTAGVVTSAKIEEYINRF